MAPCVVLFHIFLEIIVAEPPKYGGKKRTTKLTGLKKQEEKQYQNDTLLTKFSSQEEETPLKRPLPQNSPYFFDNCNKLPITQAASGDLARIKSNAVA